MRHLPLALTEIGRGVESMKFMLHLNPVVPASPEERERLRPIAHRTEKIQQMLNEMVELAQMAEELGFDIVTYSEHHFYTEGMEAGATPTPHLINLLSKDRKSTRLNSSHVS